MTIKPIQTWYGGCHFRSRLEARWAVFFDYLAMEWQYEPEGYEIRGFGRYLPDFFLPGLGVWFEVKGVLNDDPCKYCLLAMHTKHPFVIAEGDISVDNLLMHIDPDWVHECRLEETPEGENPYLGPCSGDPIWALPHFAQCPRCGAIEINTGPWTDCGCFDKEGRFDDWLEVTPAIHAAYNAARSARFGR